MAGGVTVKLSAFESLTVRVEGGAVLVDLKTPIFSTTKALSMADAEVLAGAFQWAAEAVSIQQATAARRAA
jgi:hypothetical protein